MQVNFRFSGYSRVLIIGYHEISLFLHFYVSEVMEFISRSFTKLACSSNLKNPDQLPVLQVLEGTGDWVLWIFVISPFPTFFKVTKSISRSLTKLPYSGYIENSGQLPVQQVLGGTGDCVL